MNLRYHILNSVSLLNISRPVIPFSMPEVICYLTVLPLKKNITFAASLIKQSSFLLILHLGIQ